MGKLRLRSHFPKSNRARIGTQVPDILTDICFKAEGIHNSLLTIRQTPIQSKE